MTSEKWDGREVGRQAAKFAPWGTPSPSLFVATSFCDGFRCRAGRNTPTQWNHNSYELCMRFEFLRRAFTPGNR